MKVCIAEKPSVAREIADVLGAKTKRNGYLEGNGYQVTWTFGHLCTLKEPHEYYPEWKRWNLHSLPMIPPRFGIKLIENKGIQEQFGIIESLIARADAVINCGDAGQEGELIQRWVMQKAGCKCPVYRLWISSLTEDAIREGFRNLKNQADYTKLYEAGLSRAMGDWLLGMNATRLYTLKYGQNKQVLSIGRVQTPTLALIVNRQLEIENFKPEQYWELKTVYRDTTFAATKGRFSSQEEGEAFLDIVRNRDFTVTDVSTKKGKEAPPRLFDLTALQVECNKKFAFSAEDTLKYIQSLYEKKVTTYPRVDTTFLSEDIYPKVPATLKGLTGYAVYTEPLLRGKLPKSKKVFDNSKVTDHHAIIPTGMTPRNLTEPERKVFDLVARRFIAAFYPDCLVSTTTVLGKVDKVGFKATGKQILSPGWRTVFEKESKEADADSDKQAADEEKVLPEFVVGESGPHAPVLAEKWTQPPKPYTEATLLRAMETAGKLVENEELRDALKENGIGRPSTRAAIIETLFKRNYIRKERKNLFATATGVELIGTIREELLKSAELTGIWEKKLRQIERGAYEARTFLDELKQLLAGIVQNVKQESGRTITIETAPPETTAGAKKEKASGKTKDGSEKKNRKPRASRKTENGTDEAAGGAVPTPPPGAVASSGPVAPAGSAGSSGTGSPTGSAADAPTDFPARSDRAASPDRPGNDGKRTASVTTAPPLSSGDTLFAAEPAQQATGNDSGRPEPEQPPVQPAEPGRPADPPTPPPADAPATTAGNPAIQAANDSGNKFSNRSGATSGNDRAGREPAAGLFGAAATDSSPETAGKSKSEPEPTRKPESEPVPAATPASEKPVCPVCKKGTILKGRTAYGCSEYRSGCSFRLGFDTYGSDLSDRELWAIIRKLAGNRPG